MTDKNFHGFKRILIVGDSDRGKSTLAVALAKKLGIKNYSTDDFYWKVKFTVPEEKQISIDNISKIYQQKSWIVEGSTRSLIKEGIDKSDIIIHLVYPNLLSQFWHLFLKNLTRENEKLINLLRLYRHLIYKKYKIGPQKDKTGLEEMLVSFKNKMVKLKSFREINNFIDILCYE